jgi:hypothetical protein
MEVALALPKVEVDLPVSWVVAGCELMARFCSTEEE